MITLQMKAKSYVAAAARFRRYADQIERYAAAKTPDPRRLALRAGALAQTQRIATMIAIGKNPSCNCCTAS